MVAAKGSAEPAPLCSKASRSAPAAFPRKLPGDKIVTVEGLAPNGKLHPVQQAFLLEEAFQCAYCTSGMIMSAYALLEVNANPSDDEILDYMNGNICRCGTYPRILAAIHRAAKRKP